MLERKEIIETKVHTRPGGVYKNRPNVLFTFGRQNTEKSGYTLTVITTEIINYHESTEIHNPSKHVFRFHCWVFENQNEIPTKIPLCSFY